MDEKLPIIEVTGDNLKQVWPSLSKAVKDATFVAIDCVSVVLCVCIYLVVVYMA